MRNCYDCFRSPIRSKGDFTRHGTINNVPAYWYFIWYFDCLTSVTINRCRVYWYTIFRLVNYGCRLWIGSISDIDSLIFCRTRYSFLSNVGLTSCIARNCWYIVICPFTSGPSWMRIFSEINLFCQSCSLLNRCCLTIWSCNVDSSCSRLFDVWNVNSSYW